MSENDYLNYFGEEVYVPEGRMTLQELNALPEHPMLDVFLGALADYAANVSSHGVVEVYRKISSCSIPAVTRCRIEVGNNVFHRYDKYVVTDEFNVKQAIIDAGSVQYDHLRHAVDSVPVGTEFYIWRLGVLPAMSVGLKFPFNVVALLVLDEKDSGLPEEEFHPTYYQYVLYERLIGLVRRSWPVEFGLDEGRRK